MEKHPIAAIINFCSNEKRFIKSCLEQAQIFAQQVIVPVCDHFFDGTPEDRALLEEIYASFPKCQFVEYPFIPAKIPKRIWKTVEPAHFWHSLSRLVGFSALNDSVESILFLDADEIPDGRRFAEWLDCSDYRCHMTLKMANYWYFREPQYQSLRWEDSVVLAQRRALDPDLLLRKEEREAIYDYLPGPKRRNVIGINGEPMFHHYSWVRTQEEMLKKVRTWGHKGDKNWVELVEKEFSEPFRGTDFIHGYNYKTVKTLFDIHLQEPKFDKKGASNVKRMEDRELLDLIRQKRNPFWDWFRQTFLFTRYK